MNNTDCVLTGVAVEPGAGVMARVIIGFIILSPYFAERQRSPSRRLRRVVVERLVGLASILIQIPNLTLVPGSGILQGNVA